MAEKKPAPVPVPAMTVTGDTVAAYLRENPDFLMRYPDIAPLLTPPSRDNGDGVVDFGRFLTDRLRAEIVALKSRESGLMATVESNVTGQGRIHRAVLKLLAARNEAEFARMIEVDLLAILDVQAAVLCVAPEIAARLNTEGRGVVLAGDRIGKLLTPGREATLRTTVAGDTDIFPDAPEKIGSVALLRLVFGRKTPAGILALGAQREDAFQPDHGTDLLVFLARVAEMRLRQWLTPPE